MLKRLKIRTEVIEFATLPIVYKISKNQLVKSFKPYLKGPNTMITLKSVSEILLRLISNFTDKDVQVLFILYKIVVEREIGFLSKAIEKGDWNSRKIDARKFCIFMFLQNCRTHTDSSKKELSSSWSHNQFNESFRSSHKLMGGNFSPMNSPRTKMNKQTNITEEIALKSFIKKNLNFLLWITSGAPDNKDSEGNFKGFPMSPENFILMDIIFEPESGQLKNFLPKKKKINSAKIISILEQTMTIDEKGDTIVMKSLNKCVTIKDKHFCEGKNLKIQGCEKSYIYIDSCVNYLSITNCIKCTIFVAAVRSVAAVDKCEKLKLTLSSNIIRIGNTIDSRFYTFSTYEPILFGDNRSIFLGPNNANYIKMIQRIKKAQIAFKTKSIISFAYPFIFHEFFNITNITYTIGVADNFYPMILPKEFIPIPHAISQDIHAIKVMDHEMLYKKAMENRSNIVIPYLAPQEYKDKILERHNKMKIFKEMIKAEKMTGDQEVVFLNSVQGYFRQWMSSRKEYEMITDMVKWIDKD